MSTDDLRKLIRDVPDFPKAGILFRDITPLLSDPRGFAEVVDRLAEPFLGKVDAVLGIESRGFIIGAPVAYRLGVGLTIARKPGKLPFRTVDESYELEYGTASLQMHEDAIKHGTRILIVDDLLATGGTARAAIRLANRLGGEVVACAFAVELGALGGRRLVEPISCTALISYD
ncbi:MAG TPA: adenine phosphoribosyltransferase [Candidatus Binataceae bacterium]|nr:adenine phosphoribosyltransferase [Candidatus Binataceae bacterium]